MEAYRINIIGLSHNLHHFQFDLGEAFFKRYNSGLVSAGDFSAEIALNKHETFLETDFSITGVLKLVCDRSLDEFDFPVSIQKRLIFKYGENEGEVSEDVIMIHHGTESLELGQYLYEFIGLAVPMKKLHPRYGDEEDEADGLIYSSEPGEPEKEEIDPRWEALKKLNKN